MATTTAAQRREQAKRDYDAFLERCPTRELLSRLTTAEQGQRIERALVPLFASTRAVTG